MKTYYKSKLNRKIIIRLSLILFVMMITILLVTTSSIRDLETTKFGEINKLIVKSYSNESTHIIENTFSDARTLANQLERYSEDGDLTYDDIEKIILSSLNTNTDYKGIFVIIESDEEILNPYWYYNDGEIRYETVDDYYNYAYWGPVIDKQRGIINPQMATIGSQNVMVTTLLEPIFEDGQVVGMVGIDLSLSFFQTITMGINTDRDMEVAIISDSGLILGHTDTSYLGRVIEFNAQGNVHDDIKDFANPKENYVLVSEFEMGIPNKQWYLATSVPRKIMNSSIWETDLHILFIGSLGFLLIVYFNRMTIGKSLRPIKDILTVIENATKGDLSERVHVTSKDEIENIGFGLNNLLDSLQSHHAKLEEEIILNRDLNVELEDLMKENDRIYFDTIKSLVRTIEAKDEYTAGHCDRVTNLACLMGAKLNFTNKEMTNLTYGAILHDIGKIAINDGILSKPNKLTDDEYNMIKTHPMKGVDIVTDVHFLEHAIPVIEQHHERFDGKGYPHGLKGLAIDLNARIVGITDAYDAMTSSRSYRRALSKEQAISQLTKYKGSQFDPELTELFIKIVNETDGI